MKKTKLTKICFLFIFFLSCFYSFSQIEEFTNNTHFQLSDNYDIQVIGVAKDGSKVIRITTIEKRLETAINNAQRDAVAVCIFKGLPSIGYIESTPAICDESELEKNQSFFDEFFFNYYKHNSIISYFDFIEIISTPSLSNLTKMKIKEGFKITIDVLVSYFDLREYLKSEGININN